MADFSSRGIALAGTLLLLPACGVFSKNDASSSGGTSSIGGSGGFPSGGASGNGGAGGDAGQAGGAGCLVESATIEADATISDSECNTSIYHGAEDYMNLSTHFHGLVRFTISDAVLNAFSTGQVKTLVLTLSRAPNCGGGGCPSTPGTLDAYPLRNDWLEGQSPYTPYSGADWCRYGAGQSTTAFQWGGDGASGSDDIGMKCGSKYFADADSTVTLDLNPAAFETWVQQKATGGVLSVRLSSTDGVFVAISHEDIALGAHAQMDITYCP